MLSPLNPDCQINDTSLPTGPDATMQGPFIHFTIGGDAAKRTRRIKHATPGRLHFCPESAPDRGFSNRWGRGGRPADRYRSASTSTRPACTPPSSGFVHVA